MTEYKVIDSTLVLDEQELNELGSDGWDLVTVITRPMTSTGGRVYFHYIFTKAGK